MELILKIVTFLAVVAGTSASHYLCPIPAVGYLQCGGQGISMPPPGYWPDITTLDLWKNIITELPKNSLSGFPAVKVFDLTANQLTEIDFEELASMTDLDDLAVFSNQIDTLIPPPYGITLKELQYIDISDNKISQLDPNFFSFAPNLYSLDIGNNPLVVEEGQSVLNHPKLERLVMKGTSLKEVDSSLLSGLPNLKNVWLVNAQITSIDGAFVNNNLLEEVNLRYNAITQITSGTFASDGLLQKLYLEGNPLKRLDTAALNKAMSAGGYLVIRDTPLACDCGFEALYWWAATKGITINAKCTGQAECSFTRRR